MTPQKCTADRACRKIQSLAKGGSETGDDDRDANLRLSGDVGAKLSLHCYFDPIHEVSGGSIHRPFPISPAGDRRLRRFSHGVDEVGSLLVAALTLDLVICNPWILPLINHSPRDRAQHFTRAKKTNGSVSC
jgi:hypothetical protein